MSAIVTRLPQAEEAPIRKAQRLRDEGRKSALEVAEHLAEAIAGFEGRCYDAAALDTLPAGLRDAFRKVGLELGSRHQSITQILGNVKP